MIDPTKKVDYSIEFAHIYTNESFSNEHVKAAGILREEEKRLTDGGESFVKVVMIDNYNPSDHILDVDNFFGNLERLDAKTDAFIYEADLLDYKECALDLMSERHKKSYTNYINSNGKIPCSFLIYVWYLIRLGIIEIKDYSKINNLNDKNNVFKANKIISILPERFKGVEKKAMEAIKKSDIDSNIIKNIRHIYY